MHTLYFPLYAYVKIKLNYFIGIIRKTKQTHKKNELPQKSKYRAKIL